MHLSVRFSKTQSYGPHWAVSPWREAYKISAPVCLVQLPGTGSALKKCLVKLPSVSKLGQHLLRLNTGLPPTCSPPCPSQVDMLSPSSTQLYLSVFGSFCGQLCTGGVAF